MTSCKIWKQKYSLWECRKPDRYDITRRSFNQTVGRITNAVRTPNKCMESKWRPPISKDVPGNRLVRLSPSKVMNSTQYDCNHEKILKHIYGEVQK